MIAYIYNFSFQGDFQESSQGDFEACMSHVSQNRGQIKSTSSRDKIRLHPS